MAGIFQAGYVARQGEDIFPTTGPHLDVRVKKDGQYIDPSTWRTGLQRLKIGEQKTPLFMQDKDGFKPSFPITSGFGPRSAPVAGASTFHKGIDFGIAGGTPIYYEGAGTFKPGQGLGTIQTPEGFEIQLLHTKGGKEVSLPGEQQMPPVKPPQQPAQMDAPQSINILVQTGGEEENKTISPQDQLKNYVASMFGESKSNIPIGSIAKMIASPGTTNYFG
jgi:hypothetical protein